MRSVKISGMSRLVGLLYSSIDGNLCTSALRQARRQPAERLLFHQRFAERHVDAAFDLPARQRRIERAADVVRDPDARHGESSPVSGSTSTSTIAAV